MERNNIKFNYIYIKQLYDNNQIDEAKPYLKQLFFSDSRRKYSFSMVYSLN